MATYETPGKVTLKIKVPAGLVTIETAATDRTEIDVVPRRDTETSRRMLEETRERCRERSPGHYEVEVEIPSLRRGKWWGVLFQSTPGFNVRVTAPEGTEVEIETVSADFSGQGSFGSVRARSISGDVSFDEVHGSGDLKSVSGDMEIGSIEGRANAQSVSGDVTLRRVDGELTGKTVSGDFDLGRLGRGARLTSISGDVDIESASEGELKLKTTSGDINIGVERGVSVWMDVSSLSGDTTSYLEGADEAGDVRLEIRAASLSGDVTLRSTDFAGGRA